MLPGQSFLRALPYLGIISSSVTERECIIPIFFGVRSYVQMCNKVISQLRLYAMYGQSKKVAMLMVISFAITKSWIIIQAGVFAAMLEGPRHLYLISSASTSYMHLYSDFDSTTWSSYTLLHTAQHLVILLSILDTAAFLRNPPVCACRLQRIYVLQR